MVNKKIGLGTLAMVLVFGFTAAGCATKPAISGDGLYEYKVVSFLGKKATTITQYLGTETDVTIPAQIEGITVYAIGEGAFEGKSLTGVVFPDGLDSIEDRAFAGNRLTSVSIPAGMDKTTVDLSTVPSTTIKRDGITSIGQSAFEGNPIESFTFSGEIDCLTFDSLGSITPYYYANGKKPGTYTYSVEAAGGEDGEGGDGEGGGAGGEKKWLYNGSALTELPAMIFVSGIFQAMDGKTDVPDATQINHSIKRSKIGYRPFHSGRWIPAGEHTLTVAAMESGGGAVSTNKAGPSMEVRVNFEPGMVYQITPKMEGDAVTGFDWKADGPYSSLTAE